MLKQLKLGTRTPIKAVNVRDDNMRLLIETLSYEVGTPSAGKAKEWADKAIAKMASWGWMKVQLLDPKTWIYALANRKRQITRKNTKQLDRMEKKLNRELAKGAGTTADDAKIQKLKDVIADMKEVGLQKGQTEADPQKLLKEAIVTRLESILPQRPQM